MFGSDSTVRDAISTRASKLGGDPLALLQEAWWPPPSARKWPRFVRSVGTHDGNTGQSSCSTDEGLLVIFTFIKDCVQFSWESASPCVVTQLISGGKIMTEKVRPCLGPWAMWKSHRHFFLYCPSRWQCTLRSLLSPCRRGRLQTHLPGVNLRPLSAKWMSGQVHLPSPRPN